MFDFHTHTLFSDGDLLPSELIRRMKVLGYRAVALTDHADISNLEGMVPRVKEVCAALTEYWGIQALPGVELTHVPVETIPGLARRARELGAKIVIVHGETLVEPVIPGTNLAAVRSDIDILAHPGLVTKEVAKEAKERGIFLEITSRKGHALSNGFVAKTAKQVGAKLLINSDAHGPQDFMTVEMIDNVGLGSGLDRADLETIRENSEVLLKKISSN